jgi:hypothetical protein
MLGLSEDSARTGHPVWQDSRPKKSEQSPRTVRGLSECPSGVRSDWGGECKDLAGTSEDMAWWRLRLQEEFVGMKIIQPPKPLDSKLYVDASSVWGIGLILDGKWLAWQFKEGWRSEGCEISWAEMVAVELAVRTLIAGKFTGCHVIIRSDNKGVVGALKARRSRGTQQNAVLREIVKLIQQHELWISTTWIPTLENPADGPSRGVFPVNSLLYAFPPKIPFHLREFVHNTVDYHDSRIQK